MAHRQAAQPEQAFHRIAVVGFGLVGASFAASVRAAYPDTQVLAVDIDEHTLTEALARDWATAAALPDDPAFERFVVQGCDLVVLATPVGVVAPYFEDLARWDYRGIVTDTASTKARIVALAESILPHPENFVPGHPMAGSDPAAPRELRAGPPHGRLGEERPRGRPPRPVQGRALDTLPRRRHARRALPPAARAGHLARRPRHRPAARRP
ncbi:prephenate dehydrogenase/arogenate dehydrogenase family protein [Eggerthella sinensis]|uniref:prephenate dehydrogenase/arogenate dehydrogenase family protein n=1 Tax=Eggerthella sinensis TaxID=242230 RepID=UPI003A4E0B2B